MLASSVSSKLIIIQIAAYLMAPNYLLSQVDTVFTDSRDGQQYRISNINCTIWMAEDLRLETALSFSFSDELKAIYPEIHARWYHMNEIDSLCPQGWRLPRLEDWVEYFDYLAKESGGSYLMETWESDYVFTQFVQFFDLYGAGNPLNLKPAGIFEGTLFRNSSGSDYWIEDLKTKKQIKTKQKFKFIKKSYPRTSHIHLHNKYTHIHSHEHNLEPDKPEELRRFLCRCIKE